MWKPEQLLEGKDFDPVFAHSIVRKYPDLDDILWDSCVLEMETTTSGWQTMYSHELWLFYRGECVATLTSGYVSEKQFYKYIMDS